MKGSFSPSTASLCLAAIAHTYLLFHCFPYVGYMAATLPRTFRGNLMGDVTVDSVGWYAGLLGTAFTTGRCLSFIPWKRRRKTGGVKNTLLLSLFLSAICSLWFGMSRTFLGALVARFFLGFSNTLSGCVKRIAIDAEKAAARAAKEADERGDQEPKMDKPQELVPARVLAIMWCGSALGPCLGGMLSNPGAYSQDTFLPHQIGVSFPFLLPNIVAAILCILAMLGVAMFVTEAEAAVPFLKTEVNNTTITPGEIRPLLPSNANKGNKGSQRLIASPDAFNDIWKNKSTRQHMMAYWAISFMVVCMDEAIPLFLIARFSGPGLSPTQIGWILTTAGLIVVISQNVGGISNRFLSEEGWGVYPSLKVAALLGSVPCVLVPVMLALNGGTYYSVTSVAQPESNDELLPGAAGGLDLGRPGHLSWGSFVFLAGLVGILRVFCAKYFALIGVATGRTVAPVHKDAAARIMTLGALIARAVAPAVAGIVVSLFMSRWQSHEGAALALWCVNGLFLGLGAAAFSFRLHEAAEEVDIGSGRSPPLIIYPDKRQGAKVDGKGATFGGMKRLSSEKADMSCLNEEAGNIPENIDSKTPKRSSWIDYNLRPGVDPTTVPFFIIGTHKHDKSCLPHVLTPPLMKALHQHLPMSCPYDNFWLKYSLVRDGASLATLESRVDMTKNTFVAIETFAGDVFGCFMTRPWERTHRYERSAESFLWRMRGRRSAPETRDSLDEEELNKIAVKEGDVEIFPMTGENDDCQLLSDDRIAAGGGIIDGKGGDGFGFIVEDGLAYGSSSPCVTYNNPRLVAAKDGRFKVSNMEVWAMTPFLFAKDAEKSLTSIRFMEDNLMNARGDAPSSAQSAWTQFL